MKSFGHCEREIYFIEGGLEFSTGFAVYTLLVVEDVCT